MHPKDLEHLKRLVLAASDDDLRDCADTQGRDDETESRRQDED